MCEKFARYRVPLAALLQEVGVHPEGKWILAEGADAAAMTRSVPIEKAMDDALIALARRALASGAGLSGPAFAARL